MRRAATVVALAALATLTASVSACSTVVEGTVTAAANLGHAPRPLTANELRSLLLGVGDVNSVMGASRMVVVGSSSKMFIDELVTNNDCLGAAYPAERATYQASGYKDVQEQKIREDGDTWDHIVFQSVVLFPDGQHAQDFYTGQVEAWQKCDDRTMDDRDADDPKSKQVNHWTLGTATEDDGILSMTKVQEGGEGWSCQRGLAARNNVVIDVIACADDMSDQGVRIVGKIADKITDRE